MLLNNNAPAIGLPVCLAMFCDSSPAKKEKPHVQVQGVQVFFSEVLVISLTYAHWQVGTYPYSHQRKARAVHHLTWLQTNPHGKVYAVSLKIKMFF